MSDSQLSWNTTNQQRVPQWSVSDMEYGLQGVVHTVHWTCKITRWGTEDNDFVATTGKTVLQKIDPNVEHFVEFHDLTEEQVLEWVRAEMLDQWGEVEKDITTAWKNSRWAKEHKNEDGLPWDGGVLRSTEEEEEPTWVKAATEATKFERLDMPEDEAVHSERNAGIEEEADETTDDDSGDSETDEEESPNPSGYTPMFGNNLPVPDEEE